MKKEYIFSLCFKIFNRTVMLFEFGLVLFVVFSCDDFVVVDTPSSQIVRTNVFSDDRTANSALQGVYSEMIKGGLASGNATSVGVLAGISADELLSYSVENEFDQFYRNSLLANNSHVFNAIWLSAYKFVYYSNSILEGISASDGISDSVRAQLSGEAKFLRAFSYFYLVNMFGDVPLATTTDYRINNQLSRSGVDDVYALIISDLLSAEELLSSAYLSSDRVRPNKFTVKAFLARVYLYRAEYEKAALYASAVISEDGVYQMETDLDRVFLKDSREAIWQLKPVEAELNTNEGNLYILNARPAKVALNPALIDSFEISDLRRSHWIGEFVDENDIFYYPYKYKIIYGRETFDEYSMVFRLAEQYLIRAEARKMLGDVSGAIDDLNTVRERSNATLLDKENPADVDDVASAIIGDRLREFFSEWGHRWFDLRRTGRVADVMTRSKLFEWDRNKELYPIPAIERLNNIHLDQNLGY